MEINTVKVPIDQGGSTYGVQLDLPIQPNGSVSITNVVNVADKRVTVPNGDKNKKEPVDLQDITQVTDAMNRFVQSMNANIRFKIHEKTNQLMVQVIDQSTDEVLKEFPPQKFLDTIAAIRDYVGIILDKKI